MTQVAALVSEPPHTVTKAMSLTPGWIYSWTSAPHFSLWESYLWIKCSMQAKSNTTQILRYRSATFPVELKDIINIIIISSKHYSTFHAKFIFSPKTTRLTYSSNCRFKDFLLLLIKKKKKIGLFGHGETPPGFTHLHRPHVFSYCRTRH